MAYSITRLLNSFQIQDDMGQHFFITIKDHVYGDSWLKRIAYSIELEIDYNNKNLFSNQTRWKHKNIVKLCSSDIESIENPVKLVPDPYK